MVGFRVGENMKTFLIKSMENKKMLICSYRKMDEIGAVKTYVQQKIFIVPTKQGSILQHFQSIHIHLRMTVQKGAKFGGSTSLFCAVLAWLDVKESF